MKKTLYCFLFFVLHASNTILSQVNHQRQNLEKYWKYRERLKNYVVVGDCQGCSIPAKGRAVGQDGSDSNTSFGDRTDEGDLDFPDATIHLGHYIAVLATEYKMLAQNGKNTDNNIRELYYALEAFNRLDNTAEGWWRYYYMGAASNSPNSDGSDLNGFFIRDDVSQNSDPFGGVGFGNTIVNGDLVENQLNNGYAPVADNHKAKLFSSGFYKGNNRVGVDFPDGDCNFKDRISGPTESSLDQLIQICVGLTLVAKFVPEGNNYAGKYFKDNTTIDIKTEAKLIMSRLSQNLEDNNWKIKNSVTGSCATGVFWDRPVEFDDCKCSGGGALMELFSFGFAFVNSWVQSDFGSFSDMQDYYDGRYAGAPIPATSAIAWSLPVFRNWPHHDAEGFKVYTLAALADIWQTETLETLEKNANYNINDDENKTGSYLLLSLLNRCIHNPTGSTSYTGLFDNFYECALNHAPCFGNLGNDSNTMWSGEELNGYGVWTGNESFDIEWAGLSYMLMFNLYNIEHPDYLLAHGGYQVIDPIKLAPVDVVKEGIIYNGAENIESDHKNFIASNSITAKASSSGIKYVIENDDDDQPMPYAKADVNFIAGSLVHLAPGFEAHEGVDFHASINTNVEAMNCVSLENTDCRDLLPTDVRSMLVNPDDSSSAEKIYKQFVSKNKTTIVSKNDYSSIKVIPNPNNGSFQVSVTRNEKLVAIKEIKVYDIMGKVIWENGPSANSIFNIDITGYAPGIYYVKSINEFDEMRMKKLIKQ